MAFAEYAKYDGLGLAELVRRKKVSAAELVEEAISRIETHNPKINAVVLRMYERAREKAKGKLPDGPFMGVPFMIKDLHATLEGVPTSHGNKLWKNVPAAITTELAKRWEDSGVIVVGKTNTPEFGLTPYTKSDTLGPARNPWDTSRHNRRILRRIGRGGRGAVGAARLRWRWRRLDPHPGFRLRDLRSQADARGGLRRGQSSASRGTDSTSSM